MTSSSQVKPSKTIPSIYSRSNFVLEVLPLASATTTLPTWGPSSGTVTTISDRRPWPSPLVMSLMGSTPGMRTSTTLSIFVPKRCSSAPRTTGLGDTAARAMGPLNWSVSTSLREQEAVASTAIIAAARKDNLMYLFIAMIPLNYLIGTARMLSILRMGLQSVPVLPPLPQRNSTRESKEAAVTGAPSVSLPLDW